MVKNPYASAGNTGNASSIPGSGRSPGKGHGNPLQCSCLKNPMARGAWPATVHGGPEEPGGLQSMGGQRSLAGYSPWGHKGRTLLRTHTQQQVKACTKSKNNHERETEIWELRLDQYLSSFLREFSLILMTSLSSVDRKAFGILISTINFILMSNYHSISSHHTGQKQCSCS